MPGAGTPASAASSSLLEPGETRRYDLEIGALDGAAAIEAFSARVERIRPGVDRPDGAGRPMDVDEPRAGSPRPSGDRSRWPITRSTGSTRAAADAAFRGLPDRPDDWWSEDWVGSCTLANNPDPDGRPQGLSAVEVPGLGGDTLAELIAADPEAMVGGAFADRWGPIAGILVKLLSPAGQVPLHAHPSREWAARHLGSPFGKTEAWILLDTPGRRGRARLRRDRVPARGRARGVRARPPAGTTAARSATRSTGPRSGGRGLRRPRRGAPLPRAAGLVHRGPGADRPHRHPRDGRCGRRRGDDGPGLGPRPRHDRLPGARPRGDARPGPPGAARRPTLRRPRPRRACSTTTSCRSSTRPASTWRTRSRSRTGGSRSTS